MAAKAAVVGGGEGRYSTTLYKEVLPFVALVAMECINVGLNTLFKAATNHGMNNHVFIVYAYAVAAVCLLPAPFFSNRSTVLPPLNASIMLQIFLLGVIGMETVVFRSATSRAKVVGTIVSVTGAFVVTLYQGPTIAFTTTSPSNQIQLLTSTQPNWMLGGLFLTTEYLLVPMWYIVQTQIMKVYPAEMTVVFFYNLTVSILAAIVGVFMVPDLNQWRIRLDISLVSILCSGIFGSFVNNTIHTWALRVKGPVYVAMFKPLSIAIAVAMGVILLGDTLYLGSIIGATIIAMGFYTVLWGKAQEQDDYYKESDDLESPTAEKFPLLQSYKHQHTSNR
nr:WAT1-related protein At3g28050-like [Ipomoea trifida]